MKKRPYLFLIIPLIILGSYYHFNYQNSTEIILTLISIIGYSIFNIELYSEKTDQEKCYKWIIRTYYGLLIFVLIVTIGLIMTLEIIT